VHSLNNIQKESLELKYCERCGALWVRHTKSSATLCRKCVQHLNEMPRSFAENILGKVNSIQAFSASPEVRA
jgi:ribosomal protein L40E